MRNKNGETMREYIERNRMVDYQTTLRPVVQELDRIYTIWENRILVQQLLKI